MAQFARHEEIAVNIYVGNLPYKVENAQLQALFEEHGQVTSARVIVDKMSGESKGFGFVEMPNKEEAERAISATDQQEFMGRKLRVNESRPRPSGGGGGRDGGGGGRDRKRY